VSRRVLLTVSGPIPENLSEEIADGRRPRADYFQMAEFFEADLLDPVEARRTSGPFGRLVGRVAGDFVLLAWACFVRRKRYDLVFTDGEQVGLPYAALTRLTRRRPPHVMIGHLLSVPKKVRLHRWLRLTARIDTVVVYASAQRRFAIERLGFRGDQVELSPFMVDTEFWRPERVTATPRRRPMICSAGQELRDYPTLVEAIRGLDVDVVLAAASPWSKRPDTAAGIEIPDGVEVRAFDQFGLRQLYADARVVVVPVQETDFQAGITTILEAMSMGRAVVCTRTTGQTDTIVDGENGVYVPPEDPAALRAVIERLLTEPATVARLGASARDWAVAHADVEVYARRLADVVARERAVRR
jgi:glycosyltransferase involved in cell wall biosynthesis